MLAATHMVGALGIPSETDQPRVPGVVANDATPPSPPADPRPRIQLPGKDRLQSEFAAELGHLLAAEGIFKYSGHASNYDGKARTLLPISPAQFRTQIESFVVPCKVDKDGNEIRYSLSSGDAATVLVSAQFLGKLRSVERINPVRLPVMQAGGEIKLLDEGYDKEGKILTAHGSVQYSMDTPLDEAVLFLKDLLKDFPFADATQSLAVVTAAMLTLFCLGLMPSRALLPVILYLANWPGAGKGLLAQLATLPVLGAMPTGVNPKNESEMRKHLFAAAKDGRQVILLDNMTGPLVSPALESYITATEVAGRVLGTSVTLEVRKNTLVLVTGNNVSLGKDMARRVVTAELYLDDDPGERVIENRLDETRILELRPKILAALYALVRAWADAGKPAASTINPNFVVWSRVVGGIVEHAGFGAITSTTTAVALRDPDAVDMETLVEKLHAEREAAAVTFTDLVAIARANELFESVLVADGKQSRQANTAFGRFLGTQDQRIFADGLRFVIIGTGHARRYAIRRLEVVAAA